MPRINLLPWREELRRIRQKNFGISAVGAVLAAAAILLGALAVYTSKIDYQNARLAYLDSEIKVLNDQIQEIDELESVRERLITRMEIIEDLQTQRPEVVHLFDELVKAVPDGVHLTSVKQSGSRITINGIAQSSTRVSAFMRNIDNSPWLTNPDLNVVTTVESAGSGRSSSFTIFATQTTPKGDAEESS